MFCLFALSLRTKQARANDGPLLWHGSLLELDASIVSPLTRQTTGPLYAACSQGGGAIAVRSGDAADT